MIPEPDKTRAQILARLDALENSTHIESGEVGWDYLMDGGYEETEFLLVKPDACDSQKKVVFETPFSRTPKINLGLTQIDSNCMSANLRIRIEAEDVSSRAFTIHIENDWADTVIYRYSISWLAHEANQKGKR
jgi:hypothetical protein